MQQGTNQQDEKNLEISLSDYGKISLEPCSDQ